jgi:hypothetical protein
MPQLARVLSLYVYGVFDDTSLQDNYATYAQAMSSSHFNSVVLSTFHVNPDGSLYNGLPNLMVGGKFNPDGDQYAELPAIFATIKQASGTVRQLSYSIGNAANSDDDLQAIQTVMGNYPDPADPSNPLFINIQGLSQWLHIDGIDFDFEPSPYDPWLSTVVYFTELCHNAGLGVTYCPYTASSFWLQALQETYAYFGLQAVALLNLQVYGGADPQAWISQIENYGQPLGIGDAAAFVIPGYSCTTDNACTSCGTSLCQGLAAALQASPRIRGGFAWQLGAALGCQDLAATLKRWARGFNSALNNQPCS